jgi:hypothetical protein
MIPLDRVTANVQAERVDREQESNTRSNCEQDASAENGATHNSTHSRSGLGRTNRNNLENRREPNYSSYCEQKGWCPGADLNHRHLHFQCSALPTELPGRRSTEGGRRRSAGFIEARFPAVQTSARIETTRQSGPSYKLSQQSHFKGQICIDAGFQDPSSRFGTPSSSSSLIGTA